jgi:hypothetical protein
MAQNDFAFVTNWRVQATREEVSEVLRDAHDLVRWWPSVYMEAEELEPGDARMAKGEESLRLELARRRAQTPEERARIPAPPGPTFAALIDRGDRRPPRRMALAAAFALSALAIVILRRRSSVAPARRMPSRLPRMSRRPALTPEAAISLG